MNASPSPLPADALASVLPPRASEVQAMFGRIATRYDLLNHILCGGVDLYWRWDLARRVKRQMPARVLDLATGSGDVALALKRAGAYTESCLGSDFCLPLLGIAKQKGVAPLCGADGLRLPFKAGSFDAVTIAFGVRNLVDRPRGFAEMKRVLRSGGKVYAMEFSQPVFPFRTAYFAYLRHVLPHYARLFTPEKSAYEYLAETIEAYATPEMINDELRGAGFTQVSFRRLSFGVVTLHEAGMA